MSIGSKVDDLRAEDPGSEVRNAVPVREAWVEGHLLPTLDEEPTNYPLRRTRVELVGVLLVGVGSAIESEQEIDLGDADITYCPVGYPT